MNLNVLLRDSDDFLDLLGALELRVILDVVPREVIGRIAPSPYATT